MIPDMIYVELLKNCYSEILYFTWCFQGPLVYELVGNYPSGSFFHVNRTDGRITLYRDLRYDSLGTKRYTVSLNFLEVTSIFFIGFKFLSDHNHDDKK